MARALPTVPTINFFRQHRRRLAVLQKQDKIVLWISLGIFMVVGAITVGLVVYTFSQSQKSTQLQEKDDQASRALRGMVDTEAQYLVYSARLKSLVDVWPQRGSQKDTLNFLTQLTQPGVEFQRVTFEQETRTLQFTVSTNNYFEFEKFIELLRRPEISQQVTGFSMENVSRTEEGKYRMDVALQLKAII